MTRRVYLDRLRGVATLLMIEAHTYDAWTRVDERDDFPYRAVIALGGFAAPAFLFLAGVALALAARGRLRRGADPGQVAALARRRGWQVLGLAFLFRLQSFVISGGRFPQALLKVDILNVLGVSMVAAGALWAIGRDRLGRAKWFGGVAVALLCLAPVLRQAAWLSPLPDWLEMYVRSFPGRTSFSMFPWPAFLLGGVIVGDVLAESEHPAEERRTLAKLGWAGAFLVASASVAAALPGFGWNASWTHTPYLVVLRFGVLLLAVLIAFHWERVRPAAAWAPERDLGVASLFVYWVHVEMAYGRPVAFLSRALTFGEATVGYLLLCALVYGLVRLKTTAVGRVSWRPATRSSWTTHRSTQ